MGDQARSRGVPRAAGRPPERQGRAAHAVGDLDRCDPAGARARRRRPRGRRAGGGRRGVEPRRGAVRVRRLGDRRRRRRVTEGPVGEPGDRVRGRERPGARAPRRARRCRASTSTGRSTDVRGAAEPREPVDAGDQRAPGRPRGAPALLPGRGGRRAASSRDAQPRAVKDGVRAIGLDLFGEGLEHNWTVTAIRAPDGISADDLRPIRRRLRVRPCARPRAAQGLCVQDRTLRLRQRARHHPRAGGARDDARAARVPGELGAGVAAAEQVFQAAG